MSIRFIGYESYAPASPGNYARGKSKMLRISTEPHDLEQKNNKTNRYREELDKQVQQMRRRKQEQKRKQLQQDSKRQKQFYQSLEYSKRYNNYHSPTHKNSLVRNFHMLSKQHSGNVSRFRQNNPEESYNNCIFDDQDAYNFNFQSRVAHVGKNNFKLDMPIFHNRSDLIQQDDITLEKRRRNMIDQMDRNLQGAFNAIDRSRGNSSAIDQQLERLRRRLRTQQSKLLSQGEQQSDYHNHYYNLPYKNYLYNSPNKFAHRRDRSWL